eukprot:GEMP01001732.1.p1 GENE.GEMP01001732.1~~GEMP01001732.1.p1  ORF type:complete len:1513 (+),score=371.15 GEMP01001732.1:435-4973(+)
MRQLEQENRDLLLAGSTADSTDKEHRIHSVGDSRSLSRHDSRNRLELLDALEKMRIERNKWKEEKKEFLAADRMNIKDKQCLEDRIRALEKNKMEQKQCFENEMNEIRVLAISNSEEQQRLQGQIRAIEENTREEKQRFKNEIRASEESNNEDKKLLEDHARALEYENTQLHIDIQILRSNINEQLQAFEEARLKLVAPIESTVRDKRDHTGPVNDKISTIVHEIGSAALLNAKEIEALNVQHAIMVTQTQALEDANTKARAYCTEAEKREAALNERIRKLEKYYDENKGTHGRLAAAEAERATAKTEHMKCVERITELNESHEALLNRCTELEEEVEQLRHHVTLLEGERAQTLAEKQNMNAVAADLHQQKVLALLEEKENDNKLARQQLDSQIERYVSKIYELEEANDRFICRIEMLEHELNERDGNKSELVSCSNDEREDAVDNLHEATPSDGDVNEQPESLHPARRDGDPVPAPVGARTLREESQFAFDQMVQRMSQVRADAAAEVCAMKEEKELGIMAVKRELHRVESSKDADILKINVLSSENDEAKKRIKQLLDGQRAQKEEIARCHSAVEAETERFNDTRVQLITNALRMVVTKMASYLTRQSWDAFVKVRNMTNLVGNEDEENEEEEVETYGADPDSEEQWSTMVSSGRLSLQMTCLQESTSNLNACGHNMSNTLNDFCRSLEIVRFSFPEQWNSSVYFQRFIGKLRACAKKVLNKASIVCALSERSFVSLDTLRGAVTERIFAPRLRRLDYIMLHTGFSALKQHQVNSLKETNAIALERFAEEEAANTELLRGSSDTVTSVITSQRDVFAGQPKSMKEVHMLLDSIAERATLKANGEADARDSVLSSIVSVQLSASVSDPGKLPSNNESDAFGNRQLLGFAPPVRVDTTEEALASDSIRVDKGQPVLTVDGGNMGEAGDDSNTMAADAAVTATNTEGVEKDQPPPVVVGKGPPASTSKGLPVPGSKGPPVPVGKGRPPPTSKGPYVPLGKGPPIPTKGPPVPAGKGLPVPASKGPPVPGGKGPPVPDSKGKNSSAKGGKGKAKGMPVADPGPKPPDDVVGKKFLWSSLTTTRYANSIFEQIQKANAATNEVKALTPAEIDAMELCNVPSRSSATPPATPTGGKNVMKIKVNFDTLTRLFFKKKEEAAVPTAIAIVSRRSSVLSVLEPRRSGNVEILMSGRNVTLEKVQRVVTDLDLEALPIDTLQEVLALFPNPEEAQTLKNADIGTMPRGEVFLLGLLDILDFKNRALACIIRGTFSQAVCDISEEFNCLYSCCRKILDSRALVCIFGIILQTGNFLNYGSNKGAQLGFALDTLSQLSRVASPVEKNVSLVHFIAETAWCESRESLKAALDDLSGCLDASKVDFMDACRRSNDAEKDVRRVEAILEKMNQPPESSVESRFSTMMQNFTQEGRAQLVQLQERRDALQKLMPQVSSTFGERVDTPITESLEKLGLFRRDLQNALNANHERECKRKTRLAREKHNAVDRKKREERRLARSRSVL